MPLRPIGLPLSGGLGRLEERCNDFARLILPMFLTGRRQVRVPGSARRAWAAAGAMGTSVQSFDSTCREFFAPANESPRQICDELLLSVVALWHERLFTILRRCMSVGLPSSRAGTRGACSRAGLAGLYPLRRPSNRSTVCLLVSGDASAFGIASNCRWSSDSVDRYPTPRKDRATCTPCVLLAVGTADRDPR